MLAFFVKLSVRAFFSALERVGFGVLAQLHGCDPALVLSRHFDLIGFFLKTSDP